METYVWYFMMVDGLINTIENIKETFPCFVEVKIVELNWIELTITTRIEDISSIEKRLAIYA